MYTRYSVDLLAPLVKTSISMAEVVRKLGKKPNGGNQTYIASLVKKMGLDTSHFLGRRWKKGPEYAPRYFLPWRKVLVIDRLNGRKEKVATLRRAMVEAGIPHRCRECGLDPVWQKKTLVLQIDHIDGDTMNNRQKNLRFLCPNCHSQTMNWGAKNRNALVAEQ